LTNRLLCTLLLFAAAAGDSRAENIRVPLWVEDQGGEPAAVLAPEDLTITAGGAPARADRALGPADDLMLLVVSDVVGDLTSAQMAKSALIEFVRMLPPKALVALLRAQDGLRVQLDPTIDRAQLESAVTALQVSGRAGLLEAIVNAARIGDGVQQKAAIRVAVLFVTDSDVANYREDLVNPRVNPSDRGDMSRRFPDVLVRERISKLDSTLATLRTPVFILHLSYRNDNLNDAYQTGLMTLAATTGGTSYFCRSQKEIPDAMRNMMDAIVSHYSVDVALPEQRPSVLTVQMQSDGRALRWRERFVLSSEAPEQQP
jgi:hypothetical protein